MPYADDAKNLACRVSWETRNKPTRKRIQQRYHARHPDARLLQEARKRAKKADYGCDINRSDVQVPSHCPVLGIPLFRGPGKVTANSPSLDRIDGTKGYVKGNVIVVSFKANAIKNNATMNELRQVLAFYEAIGAP